MDCTQPTILCLIQESWDWAAALAATVVALTALAAKLLHPSRKDSLALWLMGAESNEDWSRSFCALFDALFGARHLSWRCLWRSALASMLAVTLIWFLMDKAGMFGLRLNAELPIYSLLIYALVINVAADYFSLLETRWLLGRLYRLPGWQQALALVADLIVSAAIIWVAIWLLAGPVLGLEPESFAEVVGVFSILSVLFYSTFLTSVWSWAFVASTWVLRLFSKVGLASWLDVEGKPVTVLGYVLAVLTFLGAQTVSITNRSGTDGVTGFDRALCAVFPGEVCLRVASLQKSEQVPLFLILGACEGGLTDECLRRGLQANATAQVVAVELWETGCNSGSPTQCMLAGWLYLHGPAEGLEYRRAEDLLEQGCEGKSSEACSILGVAYYFGGRAEDQVLEKLQRACDLGLAMSCTQVGVVLERRDREFPTLVAANESYQKACLAGDPWGCRYLGKNREKGIGGSPDFEEANRLYQQYRQNCIRSGAQHCPSLAAGLQKRGTEGPQPPESPPMPRFESPFILDAFGEGYPLFEETCDPEGCG